MISIKCFLSGYPSLCRWPGTVDIRCCIIPEVSGDSDMSTALNHTRGLLGEAQSGLVRSTSYAWVSHLLYSRLLRQAKLNNLPLSHVSNATHYLSRSFQWIMSQASYSTINSGANTIGIRTMNLRGKSQSLYYLAFRRRLLVRKVRRGKRRVWLPSNRLLACISIASDNNSKYIKD